MKKILLPLALTLMIGGTIGANALTNMNDNDPHQDGWFGLRDGGLETETPVTVNPSQDCDGEDVLCAQQYVNGAISSTIDGGPYNK